MGYYHYHAWGSTGLTAQLHGNTLTTHQTMDPYNGRLTSVVTGANLNDPATALRHLSFSYDANNNIIARNDHINGLSETYSYDAMERITHYQLSNSNGTNVNNATSYAYDSRGNITSKSDAGTLSYNN